MGGVSRSRDVPEPRGPTRMLEAHSKGFATGQSTHEGRRQMTKEDIQRALIDRLEDVARYLFPNGKKEGRHWKVGSIDGEPGASFDINLRTGYWGDFSCSDRMDRNPINLWMGA